MNKVFKVIWSEARNAYVVVSEIAKNHGSKSCSTKKLLTMLIATGVMTCASMAPAMASNPASDDLNVTIGKGAHVSVWNGVTGKNITGDIAVGPNAHAWNGEYSYGSEGRIGSKEYLLDFGQGGVVGAESFFGIPYKYKVADGSKIAGSIAIGKNTVARTGSVMLGDHSYTGKLGDIEINPANAMTYNDGIYSTTLGAGAYNSGSLAAVTGALSIASGEDTQNTGATIYGSMNSIESATSNSKYSGVASSVLGFANRTQNANAALIWGTGNEVTNSVEKIGIDTDWNNVSVAEAQQKAIEAMQSSKYAGGSVMAIGGGNKADYATYSQLTGVQNKVTGTKAKAAKYDFVNGYQNTVTEASDVTVIGSKNEVTADGNKVIGDNHKVSGKNNVIFGSADKLTETTVNNAVVLGHNAKVTGEGGVALGVGSVADRANAVSVGSTGANRQIINVAAGEADTDAVNVSQLKKATANANKGWKLSTEGGTANQVASEATVDFSGKKDAGGHQNITVSNEGNNVKIELASELKNVTGVVNGNSRVTLGTGIAGITNGQESVIMMNGSTTINGVVGIDNTGKISGVAAGTADTDAVNVSQLKKVSDTANAGWNLSTNGAATEATNVKPGDNVDFSGDKNISVSNDGTKVKVELNKNLKDIESISNGDAKLTLGAMGGMVSEFANGQGASVKLFGDTTTINNAVTVYKDGRIAGVAAGINDNDAVNVGQLKAVGATANMGWNLATNGVATEATNVKPGDFVDFSGDKNISVSHDGTKVQVKLNENIDVNSVQTNALNSKYNLSVGTMAENGIMPFFVNSTGDFYAAHNKFHVDKDGKVTATAGEIGNVVLQNGVYYGHSTLQGGSLLLTDDNGNHSYIDAKSAKLGKVTVAEDGKISGVAAGAITADSTDAVNGSQLHAVATEAGKHSKVVNGSNINVEEFDNDGQKIYKVNLNKDIMLGDLTGKYVNISGTNGTIETTGAIATKDRVYADKGAKLADIDVTGDKISNGASSIVLDGSNVKVNDKVTIDQNGKISGVAAGEISSTSTDAINGSQLHQTNENVAANRADIDKNKADIAALDNRVTKNEQDIKQNAADIAQNKADIATNKADIATNKADIATNKANIAQNAADIKKVEALAKKHTTVAAGDNITVSDVGPNADGGKEYNVALNKDINLDSVTTGQTVMNNDGLKVGKDVSVTATAVTAGKTSISDEGVKVGDKTYISDKGLNANDQKVTNVAAGEISATSKDAVNGSQLYATNQEVANNTNRINKLGSRVNKVGAGAAALAALHPMDFDPDDKLTFSAGYGNYAGENAAAIGAYYRPDEKVMFSVAGTVGNGENMVNAGVSFALDRTNHVSNSRTALAREVIDLRGQLAVMGAKMAKMEKAFGMLDETKTKLFPDVPANHWAYEYIAKLAGNGYIEGYPDGNFGGDRLMTRYEFAAMLYRAIENGAALEEKIIKEFEPELGRIRVDRISGEDGDRDKIERVRVNDTKGERDHYGNKLAK